MVLSILLSLAEFMNAGIMNRALKALKNQTGEETLQEKLNGAGELLIALVVSKLLITILSSQNNFNMNKVTAKISNGMNTLIFEKLARKPLERDNLFSMGEITNLSQVDSNRISSIGSMGATLLVFPIEIVIGLVWLYKLMGLSLLPALVVLGVLTGINSFLGKYFKTFRMMMMKAKDSRGKLSNEIFNNIRFIKISGLENFFLWKLMKAKAEEIVWLRKLFMRSVISSTVNSSGPLLFLTTIFCTYMIWYGNLDVPTIFTVIQIFYLFKQNFSMLPFIIIFFTDLSVSARRIGFFLISEEIDDSYIKKSGVGENAVVIKNGSFYWEDPKIKAQYESEKNRVFEDKTKAIAAKMKKKNSTPSNTSDNENEIVSSLLSTEEETKKGEKIEKEPTLILKDINLCIKRGQLVALVGKIGSGKSSLLSSLLGEMYFKEGSEVEIAGRTAYVSQKPWIESKTIKDNILFGTGYREDHYNACVEYSGLKDDLKILENGEDTMLGDKGVNLSGGQKLRVALARAFYSSRDIYLFDDPISALDVHVGTAVMEKGIVEHLKGKTRIVATHSLPFLKFFDYVYIFEEGRIVEHGTYEEISVSESFETLKSKLQREEEALDASKTEDSEDKKSDSLLEDLVLQKQPSNASKSEKKDLEDPQLVSGILEIENKETKRIVESIIKEEDREYGLVSKKVYLDYVKLTGGYCGLIFLMFTLVLGCFVDFAVPWFLQFWAGLSNDEQGQVWLFLGIYLSFSGITVLISLVRTYLMFFRNLDMTKQIDFKMNFALMHASINDFFDRVPIGRILNRLMKDTTVIDNFMPWSVTFFLLAL